MYCLPDMVDLGLRKGETWPTDAHRKVAEALAIGEPSIRTRDQMISLVGKINSIPADKIKLVTMADLPAYGIQIHVSG